MSLSLEFPAADQAVLRVDGILLRSEVDAVKRQVYEHILQHGRLHVLVFLESSFDNLQAFASWDDIPEDDVIQRHVIRLALVGDVRWRDRALLFFLNAVSPFPMQFFSPEQEVLALAWLHDSVITPR
jgi:hypothetical protein